MKKLILLFILSHIFFGQGIRAQICNPNANITVPSLPSFNDTLPCVISGQVYNGVISFKCVETMFSNGTAIPIDSIRIDTVGNLPCGIIWSTNKPSRTYSKLELGCISLSGTTTDAVGQYQVNLTMTMYVGTASVPFNATSFGLKNFIRVKASVGATCTVIDTTSGFSNFTASCLTPQPINNHNPTPLTVYIDGAISIFGALCFGDTSRSVELTANALGGTGAYHYLWSPSRGLSCDTCMITNARPDATTNYTLYVTDGTNSGGSNATVEVDTINLIGSTVPVSSCGASDGRVEISLLSPYQFCPCGSGWSNGSSHRTGQYDTLFNLPAGMYYDTISTSAGCIKVFNFLVTSPCDSVWPGDANADGVVDATDALQIGSVYGANGPIRANASLLWIGQDCAVWSTTTNGINQKFADCNGDGMIDENDTIAVSQNYSLIHNKNEGAKAQASDPTISFLTISDTIRGNQNFHIKVMLGDAATPVDSLYGIAFSMNLDPAIFDTIDAQLTMNTSWIGTGGSTFSFRKTLSGQGKIDMVLARNDHHNGSGYGEIGELVLKTQPHIVTGIPVLNLTPIVIKAITATGATKTYNTQSTAVTVTGIEEATLNNFINLSPNPNNGKFVLSIDLPITIVTAQQLKIELLNIQGQVLYTERLKETPAFKKELDFTDLAKGIYLLKVSTENGVAVKRVVVQ